jgi:hypothetical protein
LVLLAHLGEIVRVLEVLPEDLELLDGVLAGDLESIFGSHVGLGVDLNADDDAIVEGMRNLTGC